MNTPITKTELLKARVEAELARHVVHWATLDGVPVSHIIREALAEYDDRRRTEEGV